MRKLTCLLASLILLMGCNTNIPQQQSDSGVTKATIQVPTDPQGHTAEQVNIMERLKRDNQIGSVKHLYIVSAYTGDVLEYSTVKGKVTSGSKRLSPGTVVGGNDGSTSTSWNTVIIGDKSFTTNEVLDDGGAYGSSGDYLYWFDAQSNYHQYYPSGGTYLHISDRPLRVKKANFTMSIE